VYPAHWAQRDPDKPAVIAADDGECLTYGRLDAGSRRLANALREFGLRPGDRLALLLENTPRFFEVVWAGMLAGLHVTPVNTHATEDDLRYMVADSGAGAFVTSDRFAGVAAELPGRVPGCRAWLMMGEAESGYLSYQEVLDAASDEPVPPDAPMGDYMLYSSGTTGRPKGVRRPASGRTISDGTMADRFMAKIFGAGESSVYLSPAPLYHGAPLGFTMATTSMGGTVVILRRFDPELALRAIERFGVTHSQWVPTMFNRMLALGGEIRDGLDLSSHRVAVHAAAPCPRHVKEAMLDWWGPILHEYYSGTEDVGLTYASPQDWLAHPGTVGRALGCTMHVCGEGGREVATGEQGLIYFDNSRESFQYHGDPEKTRGSRHPDKPAWVTLGDIGRLDSERYLYLTDRASFMIISGGVNVYPQEIEDVLLRHPT
jgi:fatty-acyl-CoA synthase